MLRLIGLWLFAFAALAAGPARADLEYSSDVTTKGLSYIVVNGEFAINDDLSKFRAEVARGRPTVVSFNSPGGNVLKAMELGRLIRGLGLATLQFRQLECASACALAFMGGTIRIADPGSIGVHRSYFDEELPVSSADAVQYIQAMTAQVIAYMTEMGVDPGLLQLSLSYASDDLRYLSGSEMAKFRVTTGDETGPAAAAPVLPPSPAEPTQRAKAQAVELVEAIIGSHTLPNLSAIEQVRGSYASELEYYGKRTRLFEVLEDKRNYFERWPERFYVVRPETMSVNCLVGICRISGIYDWSVRSLPRNRKSSGTATFSYLVDMETGQIVGENSEVISR